MIAPSAAASRSASSNTMNGALPPSSSDSFLIVGATCCISMRPTSVEPVNDSLRTVGIGAHLAADLGRLADHDVEHAGREAGAMRELGERQRRVRRGLGRLDHDGAAGRQRRRHLARDHRARKIPRRDRRAHADRLLDHDQPAIAADGRDHVAVDALAFLGEPLDVRGADGDFRARFGERLALLGGQDEREVVALREHEVVPLAHDRAAILGEHVAPCRPRAVGGFDGTPRFGRAADRDGADCAAGRGIRHRARRAVVGVGPLAVDVALHAQERGVLERRSGAFERVGSHGSSPSE